MNFKKKLKVIENIWGKDRKGTMVCPQCKGSLTLILAEPLYERDSLYLPYRTVIECDSCTFRLETESFTILGSIKNFDSHHVEIGSWSPSGSRVISRFEHILSYDLLKDLEKTGELVEFLVVNNLIVQVIG
jgi:hypothetical protein